MSSSENMVNYQYQISIVWTIGLHNGIHIANNYIATNYIVQATLRS